MKTPFQKNCQTHHEAREKCPAGICFQPWLDEVASSGARKCEGMASAGGSESDLPPPRKYKGREPRKRDNGKAGTGHVVVDAGSGPVDDGAALTAEGPKTSPLTAAEKMKAPKCRLCGKEHYGQCKGFVDAPRETVTASCTPPEAGINSGSASAAKQAPGVSDEGRYEAKTPRPAVKPAPDSTVPPQELNERATSESVPLTPAQKQKAYRERLGDEYRERNRLRMRRRRDGSL